MNKLTLCGLSLAATGLLALSGCSQPTGAPHDLSGSGPVQAASAKMIIGHYNGGIFTGRYHLIDPDLYDQIVLDLISHGQDANPQNVDAVYDSLKH